MPPDGSECRIPIVRFIRAARWALAFALTAAIAHASPFDHIGAVLDRVEPFAASPEMSDVSRVTARDLAGAFRLPLRIPVTPAGIRIPGDPRPYRYGVHQGIDFYEARRGTPVYPAATGIVVRVDRNYTPMTPEYRRRMLQRARELHGTPGSVSMPPDPEFGDVLDQLRGRQVWLYHGRNAEGKRILTVYAHLLNVGDVQVGERVSPERVIGYVGNSGTSQEGVSDVKEMHLHMEVYIGEEYWTPRRPDEVGHRLDPARDNELRRKTIRELTREK